MESPSFCLQCKKRSNCKEICEKVERELKKVTRYQREFPVGGEQELEIAEKIGQERIYGKKKRSNP